MGHQKLPPGHCIENGQIVHRWSDKKGEHAEVAAFGTVEVRSVMRYDNKPDELFVVARFSSCDRTRFEDVPVPIKQITGNGKRLLDYVPDWFVLLGTSPTKRLRFLQQILNLQRLEIKEVTEVQQAGIGYHTSSDGTLFYVLGDTILNRPPGVNIEVVSPFHLRTDQSIANELPGQSIHWTLKFCEQGPPQAAQFVATLATYIRPILEVTNNYDRFGIYILGESGTGKSETAKLLCSLFKEASGATLSSDRPDIFRLMSTYRDMPFLLDDLNSSGITNAMNKKKERLSEVLQQLSEAGLLSIRGEIFNVGLTTPVITAETLLKSHSTVNRTLIIAYDRPFNADTMSWLQENHGLYADFLTGFVEWICQNHTRLEMCVRSWDFSHLDGCIKKPDTIIGYKRLMRTFKILKITLELLLLHLREVFAIPQDDELSWRRLLAEGINQAVFADTLKHLRKESTEQERFYVDAVLDIFDDERQRYKAKDRLVASSFEEYVTLNKQAKIDGRIPKKIFFLSSDEFYYRFRGDDLVQYLIDQYGSECKASKKAFSSQLNYFGLLQPCGGELSYPAVEDSDHHYYALRRNVVEVMQKERSDELLAKAEELAFGGGDNDDQKWIIPRR